jgi:hypothetical protein
MEELGFYIVWQSGEEHFDDIIQDIRKEFDVLDVKSLHWSKDSIGKNLNMLYPHREFNNNSAKVKEIGRTKDGVRLHTIIVLDHSSNMQDGVNVNFKNLKDKYRKKYKTNFLHAADNGTEALDNISQVLNQKNFNPKKHKKQFIVFDKFNLKLINSDIVSFSSIEDVFKLLNEKIKYVVLRNWDEFDGEILSEEHSDIDILVDEHYKAFAILNAIRMKKESYRVKSSVNIDGLEIPFDIRYIGDNYYDKKWELDILDRRKFFKYFYIPDENNYYYSLLYHALVQKPFLSNDYSTKLLNLRRTNPSIQMLNIFLINKGYEFLKPKDKSVYYKFSLFHFKYLLVYKLKQHKEIWKVIKWIKK